MELEIDLKKLNEEQLKTLIDLMVESKVRDRLKENTNIIQPQTRQRTFKKDKLFTMDEIKEIWNLTTEGKTYKQISRRIKRNPNTVSNIINSIKTRTPRSKLIKEFYRSLPSTNGKRRYKHISNEEKARMLQLLKEGKKLEEIGKMFNRSPSAIIYVKKNAGKNS